MNKMNGAISALFLFTLCISAMGAVTKPNNLLLRLTFDSTPVKDESPYQRDVTVYGKPTLVTGKFGTSASVNPGAAADVFFTGQWQSGPVFSTTAWVQFSDLGNYPKILSQKDGFQDKGGWEWQFHAGVFSLVTGSGNDATSTNFNYVTNTWYHVAMTVDSGNVKFYLNGADVTADGNAAIITPFGGKDVTAGSSAKGRVINDGGHWKGLLDEVRVYDYALSAADVTAVFQEDDTRANVADPLSPVPAIASSCLANNNTGAPTTSLVFTSSDFPQNFPNRNSEYLTFSYVASNEGAATHTTATLSVKNVGTTPITVSSVVLSPATQDTNVFFQANGLANGAVIQPGATVPITINYNNYATLQAKTVVHNFLTINSNDAVRPTVVITLAGVYMTKKEGGDEIPLQSVVNGLGYAINTGVGYVSEGIETLAYNLIGDGFSSFLLRTADASLPVYLQTVAGYSPCCAASQTPGVSIVGAANGGQCGIQLKGGYTQMVFPIKNDNSGIAAATCNPVGNFWLSQDGQWASNSPASAEGLISMHMTPARDQDGTLLKNSYIFGQDYSLKTGCGFKEGQANCDFQDNIFLINNVAPADSSALDRSKTVDLPINVVFDHTFTSGLVDVNGNNVGFPQYTFSTTLDSPVLVRSYQPSLLTLDTAAKALKVQAQPGSLKGTDNNLVNGLRYPIDPQNKAFGVSATVLAPSSLNAAVSAGVFLGSDENNFVSFTYSNGNITAYAELYSFSQIQRGQDFGIDPKIDINAFNLGSASIPAGVASVELHIYADPITKTITFGYNVGQGVVFFGNKWVLPGRGVTTGLGASGRIVGFGTAAGIVAYGAAAEVSFSSFAVQTCIASQLVDAPTEVVTSANTANTDSATATSVTPGTLTNPTSNGPQNSNANPSGPQPETDSTDQTGSASAFVPSMIAILLFAFFSL